jgi:hypothetical protein
MNHIGARGMQSLALALAHNTELQELYVLELVQGVGRGVHT